MQLKTRSAAIIIMGIFWGIIGLSMITGNWQTKATVEEVVVEDPGDIKGWMTLTDVSGYFKIPVPELAKVFGLPSDVDPKQPLKEIAEEKGKEVDDLREVLAAHLGVAVTTDETKTGGEAKDKPASTEPGSSSTGSTDAAQTTSGAQAGQTKPTENGQATGGPAQPAQPSQTTEAAQSTQSADTPKSSEEGSSDSQVIKGKMTLSEVEYVTKVPAGYICQQLGIPENADRNKLLRDLGQQYGFEVDSIRDIVAKYKP